MKDADYSSSITYNSGIKTPKEEKEPPVAIVAISTLRSMRFIALSSFLCKKRKKNRSFIILPPINHRRFSIVRNNNRIFDRIGDERTLHFMGRLPHSLSPSFTEGERN